MFDNYAAVIAKFLEPADVGLRITSPPKLGAVDIDDGLTPHGAILEAARGERMSKRAAADRAGISEARWRQIVSGKQSAGGERVPVNTRPRTLASMAHAVGADVAEVFEAAGFDLSLAEQFPAQTRPVLPEGQPGDAAFAVRLARRVQELEERLEVLESLMDNTEGGGADEQRDAAAIKPAGEDRVTNLGSRRKGESKLSSIKDPYEVAGAAADDPDNEGKGGRTNEGDY